MYDEENDMMSSLHEEENECPLSSLFPVPPLLYQWLWHLRWWRRFQIHRVSTACPLVRHTDEQYRSESNYASVD